jgi:hypothetical protein
MDSNDTAEGYDVIGDIHGHGEELLALLEKLGYFHDGVSYRHATRQALFLGDFVDRGPQQRLVLRTVMAMCRRGAARAIMGNHEFNALAFQTEYPAGSGRWLRPRNNHNIKQHLVFLQAYLDDRWEMDQVLAWFMELPLWLELPEGLRLVHACWHVPAMDRLRCSLGPANTLTTDLLIKASERGSQAYEDVEALLKGRELRLPGDLTFTDKDGFERDAIRIKWWKNTADTYADLAHPCYVVKRHPCLKAESLPPGLELGYGEREMPVFFGHYWYEGLPAPEAPNVACLDYSIPRSTGKLVAYRWSGEEKLQPDHFEWVENRAGRYLPH